jgi:hypothetical protein
MAVPLLSDELQQIEKISLAALASQPGYAVLVEIMEAACKRATAEAINLNPGDEGYDRKIKFLHTRARDFNEFRTLILNSITWQIETGKQEQVQNSVGLNAPKGNR